jgi:hypothetical protein
LDLPVSRTGLTLHHSPRYDVEPKPGTFRVETDPGPWNAALRGRAIADASSAPPPPPPPAAPRPGERDMLEFKALVDRFQKEAGRTRQGALPIAIAFPSIGPSLFLAAELTPETQSPSIEVEYKKTGGR